MRDHEALFCYRPLAGAERPQRRVGFRRSTLRNHVFRRQNSRLEQKAGDAGAENQR